MVVGGIAGSSPSSVWTILLHRGLADPRIRLNSRKWDIAVAMMLWLQLALGLLTVPLSVSILTGQAEIVGVELTGTLAPLVQ